MMSEVGGEVLGEVHHIAAARTDSAGADRRGRVEAVLQPYGVRVRTIGDVYRGLAELCRADVTPPIAVVVCVDELGPGEMEFFSLARRERPGVVVLVYGGSRASARIARALALGATEVADETALRRIGEAGFGRASDVALDQSTRNALDQEEKDTSHRAAAHGLETRELETRNKKQVGRAHPTEPGAEMGGAHPTEMEPEVGGAQSTEVEPSEIETSNHGRSDVVGMGRVFSGVRELTPDAEDLPAGPVRVPWLRYQDAPVRTGPKREPVRDEVAKLSSSPATTLQSSSPPMSPLHGSPPRMTPVQGSPPPISSVPASPAPLSSLDAGPRLGREAGHAGEEYEPLLTEEELRALLGDDFGRGAMEGNGEKA